MVLIYGPDRGRVAEMAATLVKAVADDANDPFRVVEITAEALKDEPALLNDEARSLSLTGGRRAVRMKGAADALTKTLDAYLNEDPSPDAVIVLEAGELQARSSLRKLAENHARAAAIACYRDEGAGLAALAKEALGAYQVRIDEEAMRYVTAQLGADRRESRAALEKLALYAGPGATVRLRDAEAVIGDVAAADLDALCQAVAAGQAGPAQKLLQRLQAEGTNAVPILRALARHFDRLAEARTLVDAGTAAESAVDKLRPQVFFRAKAPMAAAVSRWDKAHLDRALDRLLQAEIDCKTAGMPSDLMCARAVLALTMAAPRRRR